MVRTVVAASAAALLAALLPGASRACVSGSCVQGMCSDIPADHEYYLTSFCDKSVACGSFSGDCNEYYCADYKRFGCSSVVSCCQGADCVNLKVIDGGPGCSVEDDARKQVVDASYSACKHFTGSTSCGWSDKVKVTCAKVAGVTADDAVDLLRLDNATAADLPAGKIPLGPCSYDAEFIKAKSVPHCSAGAGAGTAGAGVVLVK
jgi:hypothetical protein